MSGWKMYEAVPDEVAKLYQQGINREDFEVIPVKDKSGTVRYFAAHKKECLGFGAYGKVFKCYPLIITNGAVNVDFTKPVVAKIIRDSQYDPNEVEHIAKYYHKTYPATRIGRNIAIITDFLPGKPLNSPEVMAKLKELSFSDRTKLAKLILMNFNLMHHYTPTTGSALAHADIKAENLLVDIHYDDRLKDFTVDAAAIDFGLAEVIPDAQTSKRTPDRKGSPRTIPPEVFTGNGGVYGAKSDVFMISSLLMIVFGVEDPYESRDKIPISTFDKSNTRFDMQSIFKDVVIPDFGFDVKSLIIKFIDAMSKLEMDERPGTDEVLRFFTSLHQVALAQKYGALSKNAENPSVMAHLARMHILANNLWDKVVIAKQKINLNAFDFEAQVNLSKQIVQLAQAGKLNETNLCAMMQENQQARDMARFEKFKHDYNHARSKTHFHFMNAEHKKEICNPPAFLDIKDVENYIDDHPKSLAAKTINSQKKYLQPKSDDLDKFSLFKSIYRQQRSRAFVLFLGKEKKQEIISPTHFNNLDEVKRFCASHPKSFAASALKQVEQSQDRAPRSKARS